MRKFPKVKYPNDSETDGLLDGEVVVTEKLDGANFRWTWNDDNELVVGTRNHVYEPPYENLPKSFQHAVEYIQETNKFVDPPNVTFFGEALHRHSLDYEGIDWKNPHKGSPHVPLDSETPNVVVFDAWYNGGGWMLWDEICEMVTVGGFEVTRIIERGNPDGLALEIPEESMLGGSPEGIVIRRVDGSVRAKKVTDEFREQNAVSFEDPSKAASDAAEFVAAYITSNRIEKEAHKLVDEGKYDRPRMEMMEQLPRRVITDAIQENAWDLITSGGFEAEWDDEFKSDVRSRASKKCARTLKGELI